jgi:hypothetical protein
MRNACSKIPCGCSFLILRGDHKPTSGGQLFVVLQSEDDRSRSRFRPRPPAQTLQVAPQTYGRSMVLSSLGIPCLDAKVRTGGRLVPRAGTMRATSILKPANRRSAACDAGDRPDVPVKLTDSRADSDDAGQRFRLKPDADSDPRRTPIPSDPGQGRHRRSYGVRRPPRRRPRSADASGRSAQNSAPARCPASRAKRPLPSRCSTA